MLRMRGQGRSGRVLDWVTRSVVGVVVLWAMVLLAGQVQARVVRDRAERLLEEMRGMQVGKSTWADVEKLRARWGRSGEAKGACAPSACEYSVVVGMVYGGSSRAQRIWQVMAHEHDGGALLDVMVRNDRVLATTYTLTTLVPKGYGARWERMPAEPGYVPYSSDQYVLVARMSSEVRDLENGFYSGVPEASAVMAPDGCEGCLAVWTMYRPNAGAVEKRRLTDVNFSCVTRWKPCVDEVDIMPEAGEELVRKRLGEYGR